MKRHTCIICKRKRNEIYMKNVFKSSWACKDSYHFSVCSDHTDIRVIIKIFDLLKTLKHLNVKHLS